MALAVAAEATRRAWAEGCTCEGLDVTITRCAAGHRHAHVHHADACPLLRRSQAGSN